MAKINIKVKLISDEENLDYEILGIKNKNKITYKENDITVTLLILNNKIEMKRECNDYKIKFIFENSSSNCIYTVFGGTKTFELETKLKKLNIKNNLIEINYELEGNIFKYSLVWEEIDEKNIKGTN